MMRVALFLCVLLILMLKSCQCLAGKSSHDEKMDLQGEGHNSSKSDDHGKGGDGEELNAAGRLRHTVRGGKGGRSMGGGNSQIVRQPPSERKSSAPPRSLQRPSLPSLAPWLVGACVLASLVFSFDGSFSHVLLLVD